MIHTLTEPELIDAIVLDMDGTIADLYGRETWLEELEAESGCPYAHADPLLDMEYLNYILTLFWEYFGIPTYIVSWGSKDSIFMYDRLVEANKKRWLQDHLPIVSCENVFVAKYGTDKTGLVSSYCSNAILFDDDLNNVRAWGFQNAVHVDTPRAEAILLNTLIDIFNAKRNAFGRDDVPAL